jgi:prolyl-tRNA synthetase
VAQWPVHIVPIARKPEERAAVMAALEPVLKELKDLRIGFRLDERENVTPGFKFAESELYGYPLRLEIGPRDVQSGQLIATKRHTREKVTLPIAAAAGQIQGLLDSIQKDLFDRAKLRLTEHTKEINSYEEFKKYIAADEGFASVHWAGNVDDEKRVQEETKATHRVIPLEGPAEKGKCFLTGKESNRRVIFAKAY